MIFGPLCGMNWILGLTVTRIESFIFDDLILLLRFVYLLRSLSYSVVFMRTNSHGIDQGKRFSFIYDTPSLIIVIKTPPVPEIEIQKYKKLLGHKKNFVLFCR